MENWVNKRVNKIEAKSDDPEDLRKLELEQQEVEKLNELIHKVARVLDWWK